MTRRWATSPLVMVTIVGVAAPASAQALNELLGTLLSDGCVRLGGNLSNALVPLCSLGGAGSSSGSGTSAAETRGGDVSQAFRRLRQRQGAASADIGGQRYRVRLRARPLHRRAARGRHLSRHHDGRVPGVGSTALEVATTTITSSR